MSVTTFERYSPFCHELESLNPEWEAVAGMRIPRRFAEAEGGRSRPGALMICDVSALPKLGVVGSHAAEWLAAQGVSAPGETYEWRGLHSDGGIVVRLPFDEFFIEDGLAGRVVPVLKANLGGGQSGCYPIERQDAGLLVTGSEIFALLAQCCGVDFAREPEHAVMTRVAGVSCMVLLRKDSAALRIWCGTGAAVYLWETLGAIVQDLGGHPVGLDAVGTQLS